MKKILLVFIALSMVFVSCKKNGDTLSRIKKTGEIIIATSPDFPPFEFMENGKAVGIEMDLFAKVAEKLGAKVIIQNVEFDSIIPGLLAGKFDMGVSGFSVTEDRKKNVLFTNPFTLAGQAIVVPIGSSIKRASDIKDKKISVQSGTTADTYCNENGYNVDSFSSNTDAELALKLGKVDAWVIDNAVGAEMVRRFNEDPKNTVKLVVLDDLLTYEEYAFITDKKNESLIKEVNKALDELAKDGTTKRIFDKYDTDYRNPSKK